MTTLLIASKNLDKIDEIETILKPVSINLLSLKAFPLMPDVIEDGKTLEENSAKKACEIATWSNMITIADDTGLEIEALNGAPGVYTARFAGENCSYHDNVLKTLEVMQGEENRKAIFKTVVTIANKDRVIAQFTGILEGEIALEPRGDSGFGYDPIFIVSKFQKTLAELSGEKQMISHRALALSKLVDFLKTYDFHV